MSELAKKGVASDDGANSPYGVPTAPLCLRGPVVRPAPGTIPLRGDLAHIALATTHLVQNYVRPLPRTIGDKEAEMRLQPSDTADNMQILPPGTAVELLDIVGSWAWICLGPEGPSGFVRLAALA